MLRKDNPYSPGAGRKPVALVGRDVQIETWQAELERIEKGLDSRPLVLYGLRGIGKTVLLGKLHESAIEKGWLSIRIEANLTKSLRELVSSELEERLTEIISPSPGKKLLKALKTVTSFRAGIGLPGLFSFGIDLSGVQGSAADTGNTTGDIQRLFKDLSDACAEKNTGVSLLIDEAQDLSESDLAAVSELAHRASQDGWCFVLSLAGLPTLPGLLSKAKSYSERLYNFHRLEPLSESDAYLALTEPAKQNGVEWQKKAAMRVIELSVGYPYFLQEYGSECWLAAERSPIDRGAVEKAEPLVREHLDAGFFVARWDRTTNAQKEYLWAMASAGTKEISTKQISESLQMPTTALSSRRSELIKKGLIYAPKQGTVAFTVPLMDDFIKRQTEWGNDQ
ncbi:archaeal ATPase [Candidatus Methanoplasma termitum]|uniref:Archaeal ATPase n=1 Tax=Candidatus Methanoplasma termitum TaxID=1577791 RepID=A0A0A7LEB7_9ARCH|nr:ATP-binding protein [Candidatus Methanoplasma termitum]AIZ56622.1 archaeal ATPase [Candidatus Methanoplasma termitum]